MRNHRHPELLIPASSLEVLKTRLIWTGLYTEADME